MTTISAPTIVDDVVARTRALIPELRQRAEATAANRRVPVENIAALRAAGSLRTIQSTRNGGLGLSIRAHLDVVSALARGCGSTAWVAGVVHAHSWLLSHFPAQAQDDVYGADPDAVLSAVIGPRGRAVKTADGYRVDGVWPFASGCERSDWLLLGAMVLDGEGQVIDAGDLLVPTSTVTIKDDWHVTGLTGTGSCTVTTAGLEVPVHRFLTFPWITEGPTPGAGLHDDWVQRCAPVPVLTIALCGGAIGIAQQALEDFPALIRGKIIAYTDDPQEPHPMTHVRVGDAASRIREGEVMLYAVADELDEAAHADVELDLLTRARMRVDCATAVRRCLEGVEILFQESGASGIRTSSPLCRGLADLQAMNNHGLLKLETNQEMYGRLLVGLEPNTPLI